MLQVSPGQPQAFYHLSTNADAAQNVNCWVETGVCVHGRLHGLQKTCSQCQFVILAWAVAIVTLNRKGRTTRLSDK
jgi:hypothetical protein